MTSFGQLTNAFLKASQETTVAFANLNFDFAIVKYEAPEEYKGLGEALSQRRKHDAEDGQLHITARKLGALFSGIMPDVPNLIQAYGLRASEIAREDRVNPKVTPRQGMFADHIGADGTTIWAAATSGKETVTMHLLACMLACMWERQDAVPIWSELVQERKNRLQNLVTGSDMGFKVSDLAATRIEISRAQLDEWDASARAWLQAANTAKALQHIQFKLITDNISLSVSDHETLYESVVDAWTRALRALESLVNGAPQGIDNGAVLLGLSAWHLYPDILLAGTNQYIKQNDDLIGRGGVITIGLKNRDADEKGVFWSLPLAHARYYGGLVRAKRHAGVEQSQVTFNMFLFVVLGSVLGSWNSPLVQMELQLQLIQLVARVVRHTLKGESHFTLQQYDLESRQARLGWLLCLDAAIGRYSRAAGVEQQLMKRLISFGQRRCSQLLAGLHPPRFFGLTNFALLVGEETSPEVYDSSEPDPITPATINPSKMHQSDQASAVHFAEEVQLLSNWALRELGSKIARRAIIHHLCPTDTGHLQTRVWAGMCTKIDDRTLDLNKRFKGRHGKPACHLYHWRNPQWRSRQDFRSRVGRDGRVLMPSGVSNDPEPCRFLFGNLETAAVFLPEDEFEQIAGLVTKNQMDISQLILCIEQGDLTPDRIITLVDGYCRLEHLRPYIESLMAIDVADRIYAKLPDAKVDLQVAHYPVGQTCWWREFGKPERRKLQAIFSCVAYFQTGVFDVDTNTIGPHTFAVCHTNSIFVATCLLSDPMDQDPDVPVERITGNFGKPGLAFLIAPPDPKIREVDSSTWHMVAHEPFDGLPCEGFHGASFHLSFTGYELALDLDRRGRRDSPGCFLETAISLFDRGEWVADVDVLRASRHWIRVLSGHNCQHPPDARDNIKPLEPMVSIDSWVELLDTPIHHGVFRASGNWASRLAAAALATRLMPPRLVLVLPQQPCWACTSQVFQEVRKAKDTPRKEKEEEGQQDTREGSGIRSLQVSMSPPSLNLNEDEDEKRDSSDSENGNDYSVPGNDEAIDLGEISIFDFPDVAETECPPEDGNEDGNEDGKEDGNEDGKEDGNEDEGTAVRDVAILIF